MSDSSESMPYRFTLIFQLDRLASSGGYMHPESIRDKAQKQDLHAEIGFEQILFKDKNGRPQNKRSRRPCGSNRLRVSSILVFQSGLSPVFYKESDSSLIRLIESSCGADTPAWSACA